jgi:hypothetical protein
MVFVTGASDSAKRGPDFATVGFNAATGARLWVRRYNGPFNADSAANSVAASGQAVFVTGPSAGIGTSFDYATVATRPPLARGCGCGGTTARGTVLTIPFRWPSAQEAARFS